MSDQLDDQLRDLKAAPRPGLAGLEGAVWARIEGARENRRLSGALVPVRTACVVAALGIGLAGGSFADGAANHTPPEISAFAVDVHLAPSTLLDGQ